jgi:hypothetical protein
MSLQSLGLLPDKIDNTRGLGLSTLEAARRILAHRQNFNLKAKFLLMQVHA